MKAWKPEEDGLIIELLRSYGPRWSIIVRHLPGRTIASVRNRWLRIDKVRRKQATWQEADDGQATNKCQWSVQTKPGQACFAQIQAEVTPSVVAVHEKEGMILLADVMANVFDDVN